MREFKKIYLLNLNSQSAVAMVCYANVSCVSRHLSSRFWTLHAGRPLHVILLGRSETILPTTTGRLCFTSMHILLTANKEIGLWAQWRSDGGAGRTGRHLLGVAKGRKMPKNQKKNSRENSDCKFHMCLRARKTKRYGQRVPIVSSYVGSLAASGSNVRLML